MSWVANELGYLEAGIIPRFAVVSDGVNFFRTRGLWQYEGYVPQAGDIIFWDWNGNGIGDHVGIVEKVQNGRVYAIEGNANDRVQRLSYDLNDSRIKGYGTPAWD